MSEGDEMRSVNRSIKLTYDDYVRFPDDGLRHELIDGVHLVTAAPNLGHQRIVGDLYFLIRSYLETYPLGEVFVSPFDVVLSRFDVVEPDLLYLSHERAAAVLTPLHAKGAPELVIEVTSRGTHRRDATIKLDLYGRAGVAEYWMVDPGDETINVYRRAGQGFGVVTVLARHEDHTLTTPLFPGFELPLSRLFR